MNQNKINNLESSGWRVGSTEDFLIKPLESKFKRWGADWEILERTNDWALLSQSFSKSVNYNVCKINKNKERLLPNGVTTSPSESLPCENDYGRTAWNFGPDLAKAKEKYNSLINAD